MSWSKRAKDFVKGLLVVVALLGAFLGVVGTLTVLRHSDCNRLNAERISYLEPGHGTPGSGSIYVRGVGPGPPRSQLDAYLDAEAAMHQVGCDVPGAVLPSPASG